MSSLITFFLNSHEITDFESRASIFHISHAMKLQRFGRQFFLVKFLREKFPLLVAFLLNAESNCEGFNGCFYHEVAPVKEITHIVLKVTYEFHPDERFRITNAVEQMRFFLSLSYMRDQTVLISTVRISKVFDHKRLLEAEENVKFEMRDHGKQIEIQCYSKPPPKNDVNMNEVQQWAIKFPPLLPNQSIGNKTRSAEEERIVKRLLNALILIAPEAPLSQVK